MGVAGEGRQSIQTGIVVSVNLPSVASGFPRPSGNDGPGHFPGLVGAARRGIKLCTAGGAQGRRRLRQLLEFCQRVAAAQDFAGLGDAGGDGVGAVGGV